MVDALAQDYARQGKPVFFLEHNLDDLDQQQSRRRNLWYAARAGGNSAQTPLMLVDSGFRWSEGSVNFDREYRRLVDEALARPRSIDVTAYYRRSGADVDVDVSITNWDEAALGPGATVSAILYEDRKVLHTNRSVAAVTAGGIGTPLGYGETAGFRLQLTGVTGVTWARTHILVVVDHPSGAGNAYESLQAALAVEGSPPTATPEPTFTATAEPTAVPPTATPSPTSEASPVPTDEPMSTAVPPDPDAKVFVPVVYRRSLR